MTIKVKYDVYSTRYFIDKVLHTLFEKPMLAFDTETRGLYTMSEREEARQLLKDPDLPVDTKRIALLVANNTGLSFPSLVQVTHFVFGISDDFSIVIVTDTPELEKYVWNRLLEYDGLFAVHNTLYDLKIMYHRTGQLPKHYDDTALMAKCLVNDASNWKSKVGLKELMGDKYDPTWSIFNEYEPENLRDPKFLLYAATDGAATFNLHGMCEEMMENTTDHD